MEWFDHAKIPTHNQRNIITNYGGLADKLKAGYFELYHRLQSHQTRSHQNRRPHCM